MSMQSDDNINTEDQILNFNCSHLTVAEDSALEISLMQLQRSEQL
jgi:hypothetical protein